MTDSVLCFDEWEALDSDIPCLFLGDFYQQTDDVYRSVPAALSLWDDFNDPFLMDCDKKDDVFQLCCPITPVSNRRFSERDVPPEPSVHLMVTTFTAPSGGSAAEFGNALLDFFDAPGPDATVSILKVNHQKMSIKADVCINSAAFVLKVKIYQKRDPYAACLIEFSRYSGDGLAFNSFFRDAVDVLKNRSATVETVSVLSPWNALSDLNIAAHDNIEGIFQPLRPEPSQATPYYHFHETAVPLEPPLHLVVTTFTAPSGCSTAKLGNMLLDFFDTPGPDTTVSVLKVNHRKMSIKANVCIDSVPFVLKVKMYQKRHTQAACLIEFLRYSGDGLAFNMFFHDAVDFLESALQVSLARGSCKQSLAS